jgi:type II secretory pathway pseudopilin PulG
MAIILLLILAAGAAGAYLLARPLEAERERRTQAKLAAVYGATERFIADVGRLPVSTGELLARGALPAATLGTQGVRVGWAGPYLTSEFDPAATVKDLWGRALRYSTAGGLLAGQLRSLGADGLFGTGDDIQFPAAATSATGTVVVTIVLWNNATSAFDTNPGYIADPAQGTSATLFFPVNGTESSVSFATSLALSPPYLFVNVPRGRHALRLVSSYKGASPAMTTALVVGTAGLGQVDRVTVRLD